MAVGSPVASFGLMPAFMGCVEPDEGGDLFAPMNWAIDSRGLLVVVDPPPLEVVYPAQHNDPTISPLWMQHHRAFAKFIEAHTSSQLVLEVGGAHGILAEIACKEMGLPMAWTIIEPNPLVDPASPALVVEGWFPRDLPDTSLQWPCIAASHVLEHALDPYVFLSDCSNALQQGGDLLLTWPDMGAMAERTDLNMLNFEHLHFLPVNTVEEMVRLAGFEVFEVENFRGHSVFLHAKKRRNPTPNPTEFGTDREALAELARSYLQSLSATVSRFQEEIDAWQGDVWLFGAHIFSQYLFAMGLGADRIAGILDNAPGKQGRRLYGTQNLVSSPEVLRGTSDNLLLVAAALYEDEVLQQLKALDMSASRIVASRSNSLHLP